MKCRSLRPLFETESLNLVPGASSPLDVLLIDQAGFEAAYLGGYSAAAARFGVPDVGLIAFREMRDMLEAITAVSDMPLIVDCDTGYGGVFNVRQAVRAFEDAGAAALQLEDQTWPKRCGHMARKQVEPAELAAQKIEAAVAARQNPETVIIARTDARDVLGFDEAIARCKLFQDAGADVVKIHGPHSLDEMQIFASEIDCPLFVTLGEGEFTDTYSVDTFKDLGYRIALFPSLLLRSSVLAIREKLGQMHSERNISAMVDGLADLDAINEIVGLKKLAAFEDGLREV